MVNDVKANGGYRVPRLQEPTSKKLGTAGLIRKMTVSTTYQQAQDDGHHRRDRHQDQSEHQAERGSSEYQVEQCSTEHQAERGLCKS